MRLIYGTVLFIIGSLAVIQSASAQCTIEWASPVSGNWNEAARWSTGTLPTETDQVCIRANGTYEVTVNLNATIAGLQLGGASGAQTLVISGGRSLTVEGASGVNARGTIDLSGTLAANAALTVAGTFVWRSGILGGTGTTTISGSALFTSANAKSLASGTLRNEGTLTWDEGALYIYGGATVDNRATFNLDAVNQIYRYNGNTGSLVNAGTLRRNADGAAFINVTLENTGSVEVLKGTVNVTSESIHTGATLLASEGAALQLTGGTHTVAGTVSGAPAGSVAMTGGTLVAAEGGGALAFTGTGFRIDNGSIDAAAGLTNKGLLTLATANAKSLTAGTLRNEGTLRWTEGALYVYGGATVENIGLFEAATVNQIYQYNGATGRIVNTGTFRKTVEGLTYVNVVVENTGTMEALAGDLRLTYQSLHRSAKLDAAAGAALSFAVGTHTFEGDLTGTPKGTLAFQSGTFVVAEGKPATLQYAGTGFTWANGVFDLSGSLTNKGSLFLTTANAKSLAAGTLRNEGTLTWDEGALYIYGGATVDNRATFNLDAVNQIYRYNGNTGSLVNAGTLRRNADGAAFINVTLENTGSVEVLKGTVNVTSESIHTGATLLASEGAALQLTGGTHTVAGTVSGAPAGSVAMTGGTLVAGEGGGTLDFSGSGFRIDNGSIDAAAGLTNKGLLTLATANAKSLTAGTLRNEGTLRWTEGALYVYGGATVENIGLFEAATVNQIYQYNGATGRIVNTGTFRKTVEGLTYVNVVVENTGTMEALMGELRFTVAGTHTDMTMSVASGATVAFYGGPTTFARSNYNVPEGATLRFATGTFVLDGDMVAAPAGAFEWTGGSFAPGAGGGAFKVTGTGLQWKGGSVNAGEGALGNKGKISLTGTGGKSVASGTLRNDGVMHWDEGELYLSSATTFENSELLDVRLEAAPRVSSGSAGTIINTGRVIRSAGRSRVNFAARWFNDPGGVLESNLGTFAFSRSLWNRPGAVIQGDSGAFTVSRDSLMNAGRIAPGPGIGTLTFNNGLASDTASTLEIDINGPVRGVGHDRIQFTTNAPLSGTLDVRLGEAFTPAVGDTFHIIGTTGQFSGGFAKRLGLVDAARNVALYPSFRRKNEVLRTAGLVPSLPIEGGEEYFLTAGNVPTLAGAIKADPATAIGDRWVPVTVTGSGFAPDIDVSLVCVECDDPGLGPIPGLVSSIRPDTFWVWLDLNSGRHFGRYNLVVTDPRGGRAVTPFTITEVPPVVSVQAFKRTASEVGRDPGVFLVTLSRTLRTEMNIPFALSGTATQYLDYVLDVMGDAIVIPAGEDSFFVSVLPLNDAEEESTESVSMRLVQHGNRSASISITDGPSSDAFAVVHSQPMRAGNAGSVTLTFSGNGFSSSTVVKMTGGSGPELTAARTKVNENGTILAATFNIAAQEPGPRNLVVTGSTGEATLPDAFTVEAAVYPDVFVQIVAPPRVPRTRERLITILMHNKGNVNVVGWPFLAGLPEDAVWSIDEQGLNLPPGAHWPDIAPQIPTADGKPIYGLPQVVLAPGETRKIDVKAAFPTPQNLELVAAWVYR